MPGKYCMDGVTGYPSRPTLRGKIDKDASSMKHYLIAGLHVRSDIDIPFAAETGAGAASIDVTIRVVDDIGIPADPVVRGQTYIAGDRDLVFYPSPALGFRVRDGRTVRVSCRGDVPTREIHAYLLGSAWAALCHQRGLLPLHCSAVAHDGTVFALAGRTTTGKSTLATALALRGLSHVSDDVIVLETGPERPVIHGLPKGIKLAPETVATFGLCPGEPVGADVGSDKVYLRDPLEGPGGPFGSLVVYMLDDGPEPDITPITTADSFPALFTSVFRRTWLPLIRPREDVFRQVAALVSTIRVFRFARPRDMTCFTDGVDMLVTHIRSLPASTSLSKDGS